MKQLLLLTLSIVLLRVPGFAAPCTTGTLASYIALGSAGCVLGNLQAADFSYQAKAGGGAAEITADQITVTPLLAPTGTVGLQFAAPWSVEAGQSEGSNIGYRLLSPAAPIQVQQIRLDGNGFRAGLIGSIVVRENLASPITTATIDAYLKCDEVCTSQTSAEATVPPSAQLVVLDVATLQSKQGTAAMTSFDDWFVVCAACA
jgi:hypothetical protein